MSINDGRVRPIDNAFFTHVFILNSWTHNVGEPEPEQLQKSQIIALPQQACTSLLLSLMRVTLDPSEHMTFFLFPPELNLYAPLLIEAVFSLI